MANQLELHAEPRSTVGKHLGALRRSGYIPANIYGPGMKSLPIQIQSKEFHQIAGHATPTTMIQLSVGDEGNPRSVYLQKVQWQFVKREPFHLDFYAVNLDRAMRSSVQLVLRGEAPAAKRNDVMILQRVSQLHVEALPGATPESIAVDISGLTEVDQAIHLRDLVLPSGVTPLDDPEEMIVKVQLIRGATEEAATTEPAAATGATAPAATA